MSIWRYADLLPPTPQHAQLTLGEGSTPLLLSRRIGPSLGLERLYFKLEIANPSSSYKDRFAAAAVSDMLARGSKLCLATSSGNTGAALSAYCAAAGIACYIAVVDSAPRNKLRHMMSYGARIFSVRGFGMDPSKTSGVMGELSRLSQVTGGSLQISAYQYCPAGMAGVETLGFELAEQLPEGKAHVFCQAGGGGLTLATARAFAKLREIGRFNRTIHVECVQPEGNDTIAGPLRRGEPKAKATMSTTKVSGLQVASVIDGDDVMTACRACDGTGHLVSDEAVYEAQKRLAREEGIFSEPSGAVALAGAIKAAREGYLTKDAAVVCCVTGVGFKDEPSVERMIGPLDCPVLESEKEIAGILPA